MGGLRTVTQGAKAWLAGWLTQPARDCEPRWVDEFGTFGTHPARAWRTQPLTGTHLPPQLAHNAEHAEPLPRSSSGAPPRSSSGAPPRPEHRPEHRPGQSPDALRHGPHGAGLAAARRTGAGPGTARAQPAAGSGSTAAFCPSTCGVGPGAAPGRQPVHVEAAEAPEAHPQELPQDHCRGGGRPARPHRPRGAGDAEGAARASCSG
jgi:hypothetical protein